MIEPVPESVIVPRRRRDLAVWVKAGFGAAVLAFGGLFVASNWAELFEALADMGLMPVLGSMPIGAAGVFAAMLAWRAMLADLGARLPVADASRVFFLSQLGKYLPGSVWATLAQIELARELKVPRRASVAVSAMAIVLSLLVGLSLACALLPFGGAHALRRYRWVAFVMVAFVAALHPRVAAGALNWLLRAVRRQPLEVTPTVWGMLRAVGWQALSWTLLGLHCYVLVLGYHVDALRALPLAVGGFCFAYCLGVLFIPAPAGAGVRDTVLVLVISTVLSRPEAMSVALMSRLGLAFVDFSMGLGCWAVSGSRFPSLALSADGAKKTDG